MIRWRTLERIFRHFAACFIQGNRQWLGVWVGYALIAYLAVPSTAQTHNLSAVDLALLQDRKTLAHDMSLYIDASGRSTPIDIAHMPASLTPAVNRNVGLTRATIWLKGNFYNSSDHVTTRYLTLGSPTLENIILYRYTDASSAGDETITKIGESGTHYPIFERPVFSMDGNFAITLNPNEHVTLIAAVKSRAAIELFPVLWSKASLVKHTSSVSMIDMLATGALLAITIQAAVLSLTHSDVIFLLVAMAGLLDIGASLALHGYLYEYVFPNGGDCALRATGVLFSLAAALISAIALKTTGIEKLPIWRRIYFLDIAALLACAAAAAFLDYTLSAAAAMGWIGASNVLWLVSTIDGIRRGIPAARLCWPVLAVGFPSLSLRLASLSGLMTINWDAGHRMPYEYLTLFLIEILIIINRTRKARNERQRAYQELLEVRLSQQVRLERAVADRTLTLREALTSADRISQAKSDFLVRISHDIRAPLQSIIGFADRLRPFNLSEAAAVRSIRHNAGHTLNVINDLGDLARGEIHGRLHVAPTYIRTLLDNLCATVDAASRGNIVRVYVAEDVPLILDLDAKRITQIAYNLVENANKFTQDGIIQINASIRAAPYTHAGIDLILAVSDTGVGITPTDQARVFQPFFQAQPSNNTGVGLGLAIVHEWVERMGGAVALSSGTGKGTIVTVTIPTKPIAESTLQPNELTRVRYATSPAPLSAQGQLVIVVDDTPEICLLLEDVLQSFGFDVLSFHSGNALIAYLIELGNRPPEAILTDRTMQGGDGLSVLHHARQHLPGIPVIAISALTMRAAGTPQPDDEFDATLHKPIDMIALRRTLSRLMNLDAFVEPPLPYRQETERTSTVPNLGKSQLDAIYAYLDHYAISDILDWVAEAKTQYPQERAFLTIVESLALKGQLKALRALLDERFP